MQRIVCRVPVAQTEAGAMALGQTIVQSMNKATLGPRTKALNLSDVTRAAVVMYLNMLNNSRMAPKDLMAFDNIPIHVDPRMRFGDVVAEED